MTSCASCYMDPTAYCSGRFTAERFERNDRMEEWLRDGPPEDLDSVLRMNLGLYAELRQAAADHDRL